jgi:hypothetical protein
MLSGIVVFQFVFHLIAQGLVLHGNDLAVYLQRRTRLTVHGQQVRDGNAKETFVFLQMRQDQIPVTLRIIKNSGPVKPGGAGDPAGWEYALGG